MEQGRIIDSHFVGNRPPMPVSDAGRLAGSSADDQQVVDQILEVLVRLLARRVASIIIENGDTT